MRKPQALGTACQSLALTGNLEAAEIDPAFLLDSRYCGVNTCIRTAALSARTVLVGSNTDWLRVSELDAALQSVLLNWDHLSLQIRKMIITLIQPDGANQPETRPSCDQTYDGLNGFARLCPSSVASPWPSLDTGEVLRRLAPVKHALFAYYADAAMSQVGHAPIAIAATSRNSFSGVPLAA
ncbi:MAG: hypothetical protein JWM11_2813 [Planctomycetaceae bacterium]|nr:hypothetical protein [Planctomycetaceae bacterium]